MSSNDQITAASSMTTQAEKTVRKWEIGVTAAILIAVIWLFGSAIGDYIVGAFDNILHLVFIGLTLFGLLVILTDNKIGTLVRYIYRSLIRKLAGQFANIDPIGIRESYRDRMNEKLSELSAGLSKIKSQRIKTQQRSDANSENLKHETQLAEQAKKANRQDLLSLQGNKIARLESLNKQYVTTIGHLTEIGTCMSKYRDICVNRIADIESDISYRKEQQEFAQASNSMVAGAKAIMQGIPIEDQLYNMAGDVLDTQYTDSLGRIEDLLDSTKGILAGDEMQSAANIQSVLDRLNRLDDAVTVSSQKTIVTPVGAVAVPYSKAEIVAGNDYTDLLK